MPKPDSGSAEAGANPLSLQWTFGVNGMVPSVAHSLVSGRRAAYFYTSSNTGVIYEPKTDSQLLLQGHCNAITAACVSKDKELLVTADVGQDAIVVVWDSHTAAPLKVISDVGEGGIAAVDISADGTHLATLSNSSPQRVAIWEWKTAEKGPVVMAELDVRFEFQHHIRFNTVQSTEVVTNGAREMLFWTWSESSLTAVHPKNALGRRQKVGIMTQSVYIPFTAKVVTATTNGELILWDVPSADLEDLSTRDAVKIVKPLSKSCGINTLDVVDKLMVIGCQDGAVRFYDFQFRVVGWFEDLQAGEVTSVSFAQASVPGSATTAGGKQRKFDVPNFLVATTQGQIVECSADLMDAADPEKKRGRPILQGFDGDVVAVAAHPSAPSFASATAAGLVSIWSIPEHRLLHSRHLKENVTTLAFSPDGATLVVGLASGGLRLLSTQDDAEDGARTDSPVSPSGEKGNGRSSSQKHIVSRRAIFNGTATFNFDGTGGSEQGKGGEGRANSATKNRKALSVLHTFRHSAGAILSLAFSANSQYLAAADKDNCVALYRYFHADEDVKKPMTWIYIGKHRSHVKEITGLQFNSACVRGAEAGKEQRPHEPLRSVPHSAPPRLFSLGKDCVLHEYDLEQSSIRNGLKIKTSTSVDKLATPTCCLSLTYKDGRQHTLLTANDEYKIKLWLENVEESGLHCLQTVLAPTYGGSLTKLQLLPQRCERALAGLSYLVYTTSERVLGLIRLPLTGSPNQSVALIAHPGEIASLACSADGKYIITAGGKDRCVNLWSVALGSLEASIIVGPKGVEPFMSLIEGGAEGQLFSDIRDYFYYAQLTSQGLYNTAPRQITGEIPLAEVVNILRALGCYPTEQDVQDLLTELRFKDFDITGQIKEAITLEEFIVVYVNHRPVEGLRKRYFREAFADLGAEENGTIGRERLVEALLTAGEKMTEEELTQCLDTLLGSDPETSSHEPLPPKITAEAFAHKVLGFEDYGADTDENEANDAAEEPSQLASSPSAADELESQASGIESERQVQQSVA